MFHVASHGDQAMWAARNRCEELASAPVPRPWRGSPAVRSATLWTRIPNMGLMIALYSVTRSLVGTPALLRWNSRYKRWLHFLIVESMCSFHVKSAERVMITLRSLDSFTLSKTVPLMVSGTKSGDFEKEKTISLVLSELIFMSLESAQACE